jgi:hypothetical protein
MSGFAVRPLGATQGKATPSGGIRVPELTWSLDGGWAWGYLAPAHRELQQPIIMSDGFHVGETDRNQLYLGLNDPGGYPLINELNNRGYDVILLGYRDCTASLYDNGETAIQCIMRAIAGSAADTRLVVGGFSMGGMLTRYALTKLEWMQMDHHTEVYFSYDTPHLGAWIPISLQCLAWYIKPVYSGLADMIDSPAARQMLWRQKTSLAADPAEHPDRTEFVRRLSDIGGWPRRTRLLALANGRGDGQSNGNPPGEVAFRITKGLYKGTELFLQDRGDDVTVAKLRTLGIPTTKRTSGYPPLDSTAGGTLDSFGIAAATFNEIGGQAAEAPYPVTDFVPAISAAAVIGACLDSEQDLAMPVDQLDPERFPVDEVKTSTDNTAHTEITSELGEWLVAALPAK